MRRDFKYHNENPYRIEEEDCVCRAISKGLDLDYEVVNKLLEMSAEHNECDKLCVCCYHFLLEDVFRLPVKHSDFWETVREVAEKYPYNKVIIRIEGHLTMSENGVVYDLWDCTHKPVDCYWIVP